MFKNIKFVAFDVNGTLIGGTYHLWNKIFEEELGLKKRENAPPLKWYEVQTGKITFEELVSLTYRVEDSETLRNKAFKIYMADLKLREGCINLLEALRRKYKLVICSDTSGVTKVITKAFDLEKYFIKSFYSTDVGWMKSDREFWNLIVVSLQRRPDEFVMVGDNPRCDIHWPNVLGMGTIQIPTTEKLSSHDLEVLNDYDKPDCYVNSLDEISNILLKSS